MPSVSRRLINYRLIFPSLLHKAPLVHSHSNPLRTDRLYLPVLLWRRISGLDSSVLVAEFSVFPGKALTLLLQSLEILLLLRELLLQISNLTSSTRLLKLRCLLSGRLGVALVLLDLGFELERFEDLGAC